MSIPIGKSKTSKTTIQLEEINQKVQVEEGRLKRDRDWVKQNRQNGGFQNNEKEFYKQVGGGRAKTYQHRVQGKQNCIGGTYGNQGNLTKMPNG